MRGRQQKDKKRKRTKRLKSTEISKEAQICSAPLLCAERHKGEKSLHIKKKKKEREGFKLDRG